MHALITCRNDRPQALGLALAHIITPLILPSSASAATRLSSPSHSPATGSHDSHHPRNPSPSALWDPCLRRCLDACVCVCFSSAQHNPTKNCLPLKFDPTFRSEDPDNRVDLVLLGKMAVSSSNNFCCTSLSRRDLSEPGF